jgi:hypothetical protein
MANIQSGASGDLWTIDPNSKAGRFSLYDANGNLITYNEGQQPSGVSGIVSMGQNDEAILPMRVDRFGSQAVATNQPLFHDSFEGTVIHPNRWTITNTTMAATQSSVQGVMFNSGNITTVNTGYMLKSNRSFMKMQRQPLHCKVRLRPDHYNNSVMEFGFGDATTYNGANTTGAYWQITNTGVLQPVLTFKTVDITGSDARSLILTSNYYTFDIYMDDDEVVYTIQDTSTGLVINKQIIRLPSTAQRMWSSTQVPAMVRLYNTATIPTSPPRIFLEDIYVCSLDGANNHLASHIYAMMHRSAIDNILTGVQSAAWTNSAEPASASLSNTVPSYTTLGGKFQFAAVAGSVTDYALFGYSVPAPTTLVVTGIDIDAWVTGAAIATTATLLTWAVVTNLTLPSLATAGGAKVGLGSQSLAVATPIGGMATRISKQFQTPLVCGPGRYLDIILRIPVGTATASQIIAGMVNIEGYWQ